MFKCGDVVARHADATHAPALCSAVGGTLTSHPDLSLDVALFPFLHPGGKGGFKGASRGTRSLAAVLKQRMQQLLSPFCLLKEYVLVMYQVSLLWQWLGNASHPSTFAALQVPVPPLRHARAGACRHHACQQCRGVGAA